MPAGGVRAAAPLRAGAGRGDHDVLRRDRRQPARRRRRADRPDRADAAGLGRPPAGARRGRGVRGRAGRRDGRAGAGLARRRARDDRPRAPRPAAARDRAPRAVRAARAARLAARGDHRRRPRGRAHPPARQRRRGGADHDRVGQQGPAVPPRLPPVRLQPARLRRRAAAVPRGRRPLPRHRRQAAQRPLRQPEEVAGRGGRRRHPADLRRADPRPVPGGGLVGAVVGRGQRRHLPAAARPQAARPGGPRQPRQGARPTTRC